MKILIICKSVHHGNTKKIADAMAEVLNAEVIAPENVSSEDIKKYDLVGFGSGIYIGKHHKKLLKLADNLPNGENKTVFVFSTSDNWKQNYHKPLMDKLNSRGYKTVGEFNCKGFDDWFIFKLIGGRNKGHPNKKDIENAKKFAENIKNIENI
ncbi:flavodoxin family protein [Methanococcus aeolicus]|uniref:Flavodoxin n=1 Tax=Methanococcus aeolicus (strain ATCC BAA-1280 / DSM 17508 / OCM 812 / Nankai-3) TaxID=419665 RepID=A6UWG3_META3|nr:flavodoxin family protein [Methanococcus aeolicus]ABR56835.1 flavodoxin [Methanococcus aeolicus Nankai-3]UXM84837.1 flavodoxin family protein [Methanococcus aeolicus]